MWTVIPILSRVMKAVKLAVYMEAIIMTKNHHVKSMNRPEGLEKKFRNKAVVRMINRINLKYWIE